MGIIGRASLLILKVLHISNGYSSYIAQLFPYLASAVILYNLHHWQTAKRHQKYTLSGRSSWQASLTVVNKPSS